MHSILILHSYHLHFHDGRSTCFLQECQWQWSLWPGVLFANTPFLTVRQSHQPPWEGLHSLHWLCAPSNCVSQSSSVFVLTCHDGFAWDFTYIGQVAAQALQFVSSPLVSKGSSSQRSWKVVYRSVGFVCLLLKVVSTQSLSCGKTTEFGDSLFLLRV